MFPLRKEENKGVFPFWGKFREGVIEL